jgi:hypothetical protein
MSVLRGNRQYKTAVDIIIPAGTRVVYVRHMRQEVNEMAVAMVTLADYRSFDWLMGFEDALTAGLITEAT